MFSQAVLTLRSWEKRRIPFFTPQIGLDVLLYVGACALNNNSAKIKEIHLALGYSQDRIREVTKQLAEDGWIEIAKHNGDGRSKSVKPTDKAIKLLEEYQSRLVSGVAIITSDKNTEAPALVGNSER